MASHCTRSKAQRPSTVEYSDLVPSDVAPVAATSPSPSVSVGLSVAAIGGPESMAIESAGPCPPHPLLSREKAGRCVEACGSSSSADSCPRIPLWSSRPVAVGSQYHTLAR